MRSGCAAAKKKEGGGRTILTGGELSGGSGHGYTGEGGDDDEERGECGLHVGWFVFLQSSFGFGGFFSCGCESTETRVDEWTVRMCVCMCGRGSKGIPTKCVM